MFSSFFFEHINNSDTITKAMLDLKSAENPPNAKLLLVIEQRSNISPIVNMNYSNLEIDEHQLC